MAYQDTVSIDGALNRLHFYGRRKGRPLKESMKRLLNETLPKFAFDPEISVCTQFGRHVDCYLEIGFGGGAVAASCSRNRCARSQSSLPVPPGQQTAFRAAPAALRLGTLK